MAHPKTERSLVLIKPDGVIRGLMGEVIGRFERIGLKVVAMKMLVPTEDHVEAHYTLDPEWRVVTGQKTIKSYADKGLKHPDGDDPMVVTGVILKKLKEYLSSGPVVALVIEGAHSVAIVRKLVGSTEPLTSDVGTIRGDFVLDSYHMSNVDQRAVRNVVHASGSVDEAEKEVPHWFGREEIVAYTNVHERVMYGPSLSDMAR